MPDKDSCIFAGVQGAGKTTILSRRGRRFVSSLMGVDRWRQANHPTDLPPRGLPDGPCAIHWSLAVWREPDLPSWFEEAEPWFSRVRESFFLVAPASILAHRITERRKRGRGRKHCISTPDELYSVTTAWIRLCSKYGIPNRCVYSGGGSYRIVSTTRRTLMGILES